MTYVSLDTVLAAMSKAAPYNWCKLAVKCALIEGTLNAHATEGMVKCYTTAAALTHAGNEVIPNRWAPIRSEIEKDYSIELPETEGLAWDDVVPVSGWDWDGNTEPFSIGSGYFFWGEIDWSNSSIKLDEFQCDDGWREFFRYDQVSEGGLDLRLIYDVELTGIGIYKEEIEAFAPSMNFDAVATGIERAKPSAKGAAGRPRKWDWTGAIGAVVAVANSPDGLPIGQGAQAFIERTMAEWFLAETGNQPATSQLRAHAQKIMQMLGR